jgi:hypothetical protein
MAEQVVVAVHTLHIYSQQLIYLLLLLFQSAMLVPAAPVEQMVLSAIAEVQVLKLVLEHIYQ